MYKTIRHGENSLQYTILPQHDDYKGMDGKQRPAKTGRKRKSLMAFVGLFFVCSIIAGAILVPLMISVEFMSSPSAWFYKSPKTDKNASTGKGLGPVSKIEKLKFERTNIEIGNDEILSFNQQKKQQVYPTKQSTTVTYLPKSTELGTISESGSDLQTESTTTTTEHQPIQNLSTTPTTIFTTDFTSLTNSPTTKSPIPPTSTVAENLTKSFAKPIISIQPEFHTNTPIEHLDDVEKHKTSRNWIKSHWPIVDPSTYFSWTTYESEDNVLLPAIFCAALVAVVVFVLLCVIVRKRKCLSCSRKRHEFMAVETENGDSTILLANDCPSEDE